MTITEWIKKSVAILEKESLTTALLDVEVLVADELGKDRSWVLANPDYELNSSALKKLNTKVKRRTAHEPIAYIRGKQEFYRREFYVSPDTLTPRPETETMIEMLLHAVNSKQLTVDSSLQIIDIGTGSGCIIITAALELTATSNLSPTTSYLGLDISEKALKIAKKNAKNLGADVKFQKYDLLTDTLPLEPANCNLITANLPYVPADFKINLAASHEPKIAIYGGKDGLDLYRKLFLQISKIRDPRSKILSVFTESLPSQHNELENIAKKAGYKLKSTQDLIQLFEM
jgi:release factor glutamine methyltransferase